MSGWRAHDALGSEPGHCDSTNRIIFVLLPFSSRSASDQPDFRHRLYMAANLDCCVWRLQPRYPFSAAISRLACSSLDMWPRPLHRWWGT